MYQQYLEAFHVLDEMFKRNLSEEEKEISAPYIARWAEHVSGTVLKQSPMAGILKISDRELDLPLNLPSIENDGINLVDEELPEDLDVAAPLDMEGLLDDLDLKG